MIDRFINPFTDYGFKRLFGSEPNKDLLMDFLNAFLNDLKSPIKQVSYLNSEQLGRSKQERKAIFDIYCEGDDGKQFIVEMQNAKQAYFKDRSVYYSSFPIQSQAKRGDWNFELNAIYTVAILDFVFDDHKEDDCFHHTVKLTDVDTKEVFYDKLTYIYLEMPKFNKRVGELKTRQDKWLYLLKNLSLLTEHPKEFQERIFRKLMNEAEISNYPPEESTRYENSLKVYRDLRNTIVTSFDEGKVEGRAEGIIEGERRGKAEGRVEGLAEGIIEGERKGKAEGIIEGKLANATKMLQKGYAVADIVDITGLSEAEIQALQ